VAFLLLQALVRLFPHAHDALVAPLSPAQWLALLMWVAFSAYAEGYRAFQLRWAPRVVARAIYLGQKPRALHVALAPAFCMSLFHATRRRLVISWLTVGLIAGAVVLVRRLPQPWRGIIDAGVVVGLAWGLLALLLQYARALRGEPPVTSADLP
jgi:hypothetical protein